MANVVDIIVRGQDNASHIFKRIGDQAERAFDQARRSFNRLENDMRNIPNVDIDVDANTKKAMAEISALKARLEALESDDVEIRFHANTRPLLASILALGPAIAPVLATTSAAIMGLVTAFGAAGIGAVAFAAVAVPAIKRVFNETDNLTKKEREAQKALKEFQSFWSGFAASFRDPILDIFIKSLGTLQTALTGLKPVFAASVAAVSEMFDGIDKAIRSSEMQTFFDWLAQNAGPQLKAFGAIFGNVMRGVMNLMMAFGPLSQEMMNGLVGLTQRFADWSAQLSQSKGFQEFVNYVRANGPLVMSVLGGLWDLMMNLLKAMAPFGTAILKVADGFLKFTNALLEANPAVGKIAVAIGIAVGAFKLLAPPILATIGLLNRLKPYLIQAGKAIMDFAKNFKNLGSIARIAGPIGAVIGVLTLLYNKSKEFANFVNGAFKGMWESLKNTFEKFKSSLEPLKSSFDGIKEAAASLWNAIEPLAMVIGTVLVGAVVLVVSILNGLLRMIAPLIGAVMNLVEAVIWLVDAFLKLAQGDYSGFADSWMNAAEALWEMLKNLGTSILEFFKGLWDTLVQVAAQFGVDLNQVLADAWNAVKSALQSAWESVKQWFSDLWQSIKQTAMDVWNSIVEFFASLLDPIMAAIQPIIEWIKHHWNELKEFFSVLWDMIKALFVLAWTLIKAAIMPIIQPIIDWIKNAWDTLKSWLTSLWNSLVSVASSAWNAVKSAIMTIVSPIVSWLSDKWNSIKNTARTVWNAIKSTATSVWNSIKSGIQKAIEPIVSWLSNKWNSIKSTASSVWKSIKKSIEDPIKDAKNTLLGIIGDIVSAFAGMKITIPKPRLPKINVGRATTNVGGMSIPYPTFSVSWFAKGGLFDGPSVVGVGEAGKEAIIPLSGPHMRPFAQTIAQEMGRNKPSNEKTIHIENLNIYEAKTQPTEQSIMTALRRVEWLHG